MRRIFFLLLSFSLFAAFTANAYAHEIPEERDDCSIEVTVQYDGADITGGTLTAVKVGYVAEEDGNYMFCNVIDHTVIDNLESVDAAEQMLQIYAGSKASNLFDVYTVDVENGKAFFEGIPTGLYLIVQEEEAPGYMKMTPFLVTMPYKKDGRYVYHVDAEMKSALKPETVPEQEELKEPEGNLPQTGQLNWPIPILALCGLLLFGFGWKQKYSAEDRK